MLLVYLTSQFSFSQDRDKVRNTLKKLGEKNINDTVKALLLYDLGKEFSVSNPDTVMKVARQGLEISNKNNFKKGICLSSHLIAVAKEMVSEADSSLYFFSYALEISKDLKDRTLIASNYNGLGEAYAMKSNFIKANECYQNALILFREINDRTGQSSVLGRIGNLHYYANEFDKAEDYYLKALQLAKAANSYPDIQSNTGNLGNLYYRRSLAFGAGGEKVKRDSLSNLAIVYLKLALEMAERVSNKPAASMNNGNIGNAYYSRGDTVTAFQYYNKAIAIDKSINNITGLADQYCNFGWLYYESKKYKESEAYTKRSIELCDSLGKLNALFNVYENLSILYEETHRFKEALNAEKKFIQIRDSVFSIENSKKEVAKTLKFKMDTKEALAKEEADRQAIIRNTFMAACGIMFFVAILVYRSYRNKSKANQLISEQKKELELQKEILDEKNKEVTDSIHYAKRIQISLLPTEKFMERQLNALQSKK
jgi:tetratricopeptide (TPR) repeat protein